MKLTPKGTLHPPSPGAWLRAILHIPPHRILGKLRHQRSLRHRLATWNSLLVQKTTPAPQEIPADPALDAFAEVYKCQGTRFKTPEAIAKGIFESRGLRHDFGAIDAMRWDAPFAEDHSRLQWQHDLCFFSFALPYADSHPTTAAPVLAQLVTRLETAHPLTPASATTSLPFVWSPIALSLRLLSLASVVSLLRKSSPRPALAELSPILAHIQLCRTLMKTSIERYLGYNHQVFGEMALYASALALGKPCRTHAHAAAEALAAHTLPDGLWAERSATYHIHMLLLGRALAAAEAARGVPTPDLDETLTKMQAALPCLVHPDGEIALFNDAAMQDAVRPAEVGWHPDQTVKPLHLLPKAGFARMERAGTCAIMAAGKLGPDDVPGHGHGGFLSVEVSLNRTRLFVDPGVASIVDGPARYWTRSAQTHNGPTLSGLEPAEFFGAWRVGRRGRAWFEPVPDRPDDAAPLTLNGSCDGYKRHAGLVHRHLTLHPDGTLEIADHWPKRWAKRGRSRFTLPSDWTIRDEGGPDITLEHKGGSRAILSVTLGQLQTVHPSKWYPFGPLNPAEANMLIFQPDAPQSSLRLWLRPAAPTTNPQPAP